MYCRVQKILYISLFVLSVQGLSACQPVSNHHGTPSPTHPPVTQPHTVMTDEWAVRLKPGTDPRALAEEYGAIYLGPVGSLKNTWLLRRPGFNLPDSQDPLRHDLRVVWLERQLRRQMQKKPTESEKSYRNH